MNNIKLKLTVTLLFCLLCGNMVCAYAALSDIDKSIITITMTSVLTDTDHFYYVDADVNWDDTISVWYVPKNTDQESTVTAVSEVLGTYYGICKSHSEISDFYINIGTKDNVGGKMYCLRDWINELGSNPSNEELGLLVMRVIMTIET